MTAQEDAPPTSGRAATVLATVLRDYLPGLGALGIVLYGVLRLAYVFFYTRLRATPEEVGYTYARILAESLAGAVELIILVTLLLGTLVALGRVASLLWARRGRASATDATAVRSALAAAVRTAAVRCVAAAAVTVLLSLPVLAWWQGGLAQRGQTVRNVYFKWVPNLPVLAVQAVPADVAWIDGDAERSFPLARRPCLMYLGAADGTAVFYDAFSAESIRVPQSGIVVSLRFDHWVPDVCR